MGKKRKKGTQGNAGRVAKGGDFLKKTPKKNVRSTAGERVRVFVRVRTYPDGSRGGDRWVVREKSIQAKGSAAAFSFDQCFDAGSTTGDVFDAAARPVVDKAMQGYNGTIFAYGQTDSGKTHTIVGDDGDPGFVPLAVKSIFNTIAKATGVIYLLRVSYMEIYNEQVNDLLRNGAVTAGSTLRESEGKFVCSPPLVERVVTSNTEVLAILQQGNSRRRTGMSHLNSDSSRSHSIFRIVIERMGRADGGTGSSNLVHARPEGGGVFHTLGGSRGEVGTTVCLSELNLVDLAGSEALTFDYGSEQRKETRHINTSLSQLKNVIQALSEGSKYIPYRNSSLTKLLASSIGVNAHTACICTVSLAEECARATKHTLIFGGIARKVKSAPKQKSAGASAEIHRYEREIMALKTQLASAEELEQEKLAIEQKYIQLVQEMEVHKKKEETSNVANFWMGNPTSHDSPKGNATFKSEVISDLEERLAARDSSVTRLTEQMAVMRQHLHRSEVRALDALEDEHVLLREDHDTIQALRGRIADLEMQVEESIHQMRQDTVEKQQLQSRVIDLEEQLLSSGLSTHTSTRKDTHKFDPSESFAAEDVANEAKAAREELARALEENSSLRRKIEELLSDRGQVIKEGVEIAEAYEADVDLLHKQVEKLVARSQEHEAIITKLRAQ